MAWQIDYEGNAYTLDLDDMDLSQARAMERLGVPNLKELEEGLIAGETNSLTVAYWLMLVQNGEPGARIERVVFKPMKFAKAVLAAVLKAIEEAEEAAKAAEADPKEEVEPAG